VKRKAPVSDGGLLLWSIHKVVPSGPDWIHEVKHDGYLYRCAGRAIRYGSTPGADSTGRAAILRLCAGGDGIAVFADLHRRGVVTEAMLYAFHLLEYGGEDLRPFPLSDRKRLLAKVVGRRSLGIVLSQHTDEDIFRGVCQMGLEGIVSKRLSSPYRSGRSTDWLKIKNPDSPAMVRHREGDW
jgi:bifunctional non-homologous end joining protein LigD